MGGKQAKKIQEGKSDKTDRGGDRHTEDQWVSDKTAVLINLNVLNIVT